MADIQTHHDIHIQIVSMIYIYIQQYYGIISTKTYSDQTNSFSKMRCEQYQYVVHRIHFHYKLIKCETHSKWMSIWMNLGKMFRLIWFSKCVNDITTLYIDLSLAATLVLFECLESHKFQWIWEIERERARDRKKN